MRSFSLIALAALFIGFAAAAPVPAPQLGGLTDAGSGLEQELGGLTQGSGLGGLTDLGGLTGEAGQTTGGLTQDLNARQELSILGD